MPPKRKQGEPDVDEQRELFRLRGDLPLYQSGDKSDLVLTADGQRLFLHQQLLISHVGKFKQLLTRGNGLPRDRSGKKEYTVTDHDVRSVRLVVDFVYGKWMAELMEFQSEKQAVIQDCILLFKLGHDFEIPRMVKYAIKHLEIYLSKKLKDICVYPLHKAKQAAGREEFLKDLQAGIKQVEPAPEYETVLPWRMLVDFVVVAAPVLMHKTLFRWNIDEVEGYLPDKFIRETLLGIFATQYQTVWMKNLRVRPAKLLKPEPKKRGCCAGCGEAVANNQKVVFNPWSQQRFGQRYAQFCCEECAEEMDDGDRKGVVWNIFDDDVKKE